MLNTKKIRVGIIGTGGIAASHMNAYKALPNVEIVAGADIVPGKAEKFFESIGVNAKAFTDYKEMIDTMELDAVSICSIVTTHKDCSIYALDHGVDVLLEKPLCVTLDEAVEIRKAEKRNGKFVSVGFQPRFDVNMQMIKKIVQSGELGDIYYVQTGGGRRHGIPVRWSDTFIKKETAGLGALGDIGCYSLDLVMNALDYPKPLTVTGNAAGIFGNKPEAYAAYDKEKAKSCAAKFNVDDFAAGYIRLEGGIILDFRISWFMHLDTHGDTIIMGTKGSLRIPSTECWNGSFVKPMIIYYDDENGNPTQKEVPLFPPTEDLPGEKIKTFVDAVINRTGAPVPTSQIIYNQAIIDGISRSSELGREIVIEIPEI